MRPWILLVILVILFSGCVSGGTLLGEGIVIEAFEPDFPQVFTGEQVQLTLQIRNAGTADARELSLSLSGADWLDRPIGSCINQPALAAQPMLQFAVWRFIVAGANRGDVALWR